MAYVSFNIMYVWRMITVYKTWEYIDNETVKNICFHKLTNKRRITDCALDMVFTKRQNILTLNFLPTATS